MIEHHKLPEDGALTAAEVRLAAAIRGIYDGMDPELRAECNLLAELDPDCYGMRARHDEMGGLENLWAGRRIGWVSPEVWAE